MFAAEYDKVWSLYEAAIVQPKEKEPYFSLSTVIDVHPILENGQENFQPKYSPDGKEVAYLETRTTLKVLNLETKQTRLTYCRGRITIPMRMETNGLIGCSGWEMVPWSRINQPERWSGEVGLVDAAGQQEVTYLTKSGYSSFHPIWAVDGKTMVWTNDKFGLHGDGSGGRGQLDIFEMFFTQEAMDQFKLSPAEYDAVKAREDEEKKKKEAEKSKEAKEQASPSASPSPQTKEETPKVEPIKIDLANIEDSGQHGADPGVCSIV